jgi:hypothetical protein
VVDGRYASLPGPKNNMETEKERRKEKRKRERENVKKAIP